MTRPSRAPVRWLVVVLFAVAMAWVEAAAVFYLRSTVDRLTPYQPNPLPIHGLLGNVELVREAATLVMLAAVGVLAGRTAVARAGYAAVAFGVWDIFYYVFLWAIAGWPHSIFEWDVLFLLPLPWWGPVLAPMLIAALLVAGGTLASETRAPFAARAWPLCWAGIALALYVFMTDAIRALRNGVDVTTVLPHVFNWPAFVVALGLMAAPVLATAWNLRPRAPAYVPTGT